jgi:hypothetical protein
MRVIVLQHNISSRSNHDNPWPRHWEKLAICKQKYLLPESG